MTPILTPILAFIPMQLFAYYIAVERGNDVDKPRNLAKFHPKKSIGFGRELNRLQRMVLIKPMQPVMR